MWVLVRMRMEVRVVPIVLMGAAVSVSGQLQGREPKARQQQDGTDDRVLRALNRGAEVQANSDDEGPQGDRDEDVGDARKPGQPSHPSERVAAGASDDR
jgi:hypothetical protein